MELRDAEDGEVASKKRSETITLGAVDVLVKRSKDEDDGVIEKRHPHHHG